MSKVNKVPEPFFHIKVKNKVTCRLVLEDFATSPEEIDSLVRFYGSCWPKPNYEVFCNGFQLSPVDSKYDIGWRK